MTASDIEDVAQEAVLRAWRQRRSCRSPASPDAWLMQIVRNEAVRASARRRDALADHDHSQARELGGWVAEDTDLQVTVASALRRLEEDDQRLLALRYEEDLTQPAIASAMNLPEGTVKVRLHRLRNRLRLELADGVGVPVTTPNPSGEPPHCRLDD